jgi:hypothetical protein
MVKFNYSNKLADVKIDIGVPEHAKKNQPIQTGAGRQKRITKPCFCKHCPVEAAKIHSVHSVKCILEAIGLWHPMNPGQPKVCRSKP